MSESLGALVGRAAQPLLWANKSRWIFLLKAAAAWTLGLSLPGCDSVEQAVGQTKTVATAALAPFASASDQAVASKAPGIAGTELDGIFKRYPLASSQGGDHYPRVAITVISMTPGLLRPGRPNAGQCIRFKIRLRTNAKTSRPFEGLQMCASDKSMGVPFRTLTYWPSQYLPRDSTGAVRTDGPKRPTTNFPTEAKFASAWFDDTAQGFFYVGSILYQLGYDWNQPGEDRAWFVSAPGS